MKIRKAPTVPTVEQFSNKQETKRIYGFSTIYHSDPSEWSPVDNLIVLLEKAKQDYPKGTFNFALDYDGCCYEGDTPSVKLEVTSPIFAKDLFDKAMAEYHVKRKAYDAWYAENKAGVDAELENRRKYAAELKKLNKKFDK
jgi:hypothetical protein